MSGNAPRDLEVWCNALDCPERATKDLGIMRYCDRHHDERSKWSLDDDSVKRVWLVEWQNPEQDRWGRKLFASMESAEEFRSRVWDAARLLGVDCSKVCPVVNEVEVEP